MSVVIKDIDRGYGRLRKALNKTQWDVKIGVPDTPHVDAKGRTMPMDELMAVHEFGLGNNPERSFLRAWVDEHYEEILERMANATRAGIGAGDLYSALKFVGQWGVDEIRKRIWARIPPELNEETVKRKGGSTPLVDTGQAVNSIVDEVEGR